MRRIFLGLLLIATYFTYAQNNTVHIDPTYSGTETGTINQPFNSWSDISFSSNTTYLQKRGTTAQGCFEVIGKTDLTIGAYGSGENPIITGVPGSETSIIVFGNANKYLIEDITLVGHHPNSPTAGIYLWGNWSSNGNKTSYDITIRNLDISFCYNGLRIIPLQTDIDKVTVDGCTIHHIKEDGIFIDDCSEFTCRNTHIFKVNQDWHYVGHTMAIAPGDGIQFTGDCDNFLVENCIIDRRHTGLKFCLIHQDNVNGAYKNDGIIRDCIFYPPKDTIGAESAGGALYIFAGDSVIIERCKIIGRDRTYSAPGDGDVGGPVGELGFDYTDVRYCLFDSVAILRSNLNNNVLNFNNNTYTSNYNGTPLILTGGVTHIKNSIVALGPNTSYNFGIGTVDSTLVYQGNLSTWDNNLGFVNNQSGNLHLTSNSVAVDKGINLGYYYDLDSVPVPQGNIPDLGCYEYIQGTSGQAPVPQFNSSETEIFEGENITFIDQSLYSPTSWAWDFEGGTPASSNFQNPIVTYENEGVYNVTLTATNQYGSDQIIEIDYINVISQGDPPIANFTVSDSVFYAGDEVLFNDLSLNPINSWFWTFEGGFPPASFTKNPTVQYSTPGTFNVTLRVMNEYGEDIMEKTNYITSVEPVFPPPTANFTVNDSMIYTSEEVIFTDLSLNQVNSWFWSFEGGFPQASFSQNPSVQYANSGTFNVSLKVINDYGEDVLIKNDYITVSDPNFPPISYFSVNDPTPYQNQNILFTDQSENDPVFWLWQFEGGFPSASYSKNPVVTYKDTGYYSVSLTTTNEFGSDQLVIPDYIHVGNSPFIPIPEFTVNSLEVGVDQDVIFTDQSDNNPTFWKWVIIGAFPSVSFGPSPQFMFPNPGYYDVKLIVSNDYGSAEIIKNDYINVKNVTNVPVPNFTVDNLIINAGEDINFSDQSFNNPVSWFWEFDGGFPSISFTKSPEIAYFTSGVYAVTLTISNEYGTNTITKYNYITVNP